MARCWGQAGNKAFNINHAKEHLTVNIWGKKGIIVSLDMGVDSPPMQCLHKFSPRHHHSQTTGLAVITLHVWSCG